MKYLSLIRHAEAAQPLGVQDRDRMLSGYGVQMAPRLGRRLEQQGFMPDLVLVSPAVRTQETARIICYEIGFPVESCITHESIYRATFRQLVQLLHEVEEDRQHVLIVGHNPSLSELGLYLCNPQHSAGVPNHMATCSLLRMALPVEYWALVEESCAQFLEYDTPENMNS